jgi:hypothetical protein
VSNKPVDYGTAYAALEKLGKLLTPLQPHQERVKHRIQEQPGLVVAHGLGTGKTLASIASADALNMPTTVVVPAALQANYLKELQAHRAEGADNFNITSLQKATRSQDLPDLKDQLLIVDEAHKLREPATKAHQYFKKLNPAKRMYLTASPVYNHPSDLASLVNLAAGSKVLPNTRNDFESTFTKMEKIRPSFWGRLRGVKPGERQVLQNIPQLKDVLHKWVDYHENKDTGDFPTSSEKIIHVPMSEKQQEVQDALLDKAPPWVRYKIKNNLPPSKQEKQLINSFLTTQRQLASSPQAFSHGMTTEEAVKHSPKLQLAVKNLMARMNENPNHKAVIYSNYLESGLTPYKHLLEQHKVPYGMFTGAMKKPEREQLVRDYNDNKIKALLLSTAGAEGLDLKGTRQIQLLDPHFNEEKMRQIIGRGVRYKSHSHLPEAERNVDVERYLAQNRPGFIKRIFGGRPDTSSEEYLHQLSQDKLKLNDQVVRLLRAQDAEGMPKAAEYAPGIPDRHYHAPLPDVKKPLTWKMSLQEHHADRAGHHYDLRLIDPETGHAHSWALPAAHMPEPGKSVLALQQPTHTSEYALNFGKDKEQAITKGYGKGRVKIKALDEIEVYHSKPEATGTRVRFNIYKSTGPEEYAIVNTGPGKDRLVNKTYHKDRLEHLSLGEKPKTKELGLASINFDNNDEVMMPKYDGAHTLLDLNTEGKIPRLFSYRTPKRHTAGVIEHTHKVPSLLEMRVPKELKGTVLRTETIGVDGKGKAVPAKDIAGMLNATVPNSRARQVELGTTLKPIILDVERYKGKSVQHLPFKERYELAKSIGQQMNLQVTDAAYDAKTKRKLLKLIGSGKHLMTTEGVVLRPLHQVGSPTKAKFRPDHDVHVREIFGATGKDGMALDRAGGFRYSHTPNGPIVGSVGTGFDHALLKDMLSKPHNYTGRVAKVQAEQKYESGALGKASFMEWHLDKGKQIN